MNSLGKKLYHKAKAKGKVTDAMRREYKTQKNNMRTMRERKGSGLVASGLVNETVNGGKLVSMKKVHRLLN